MDLFHAYDYFQQAIEECSSEILSCSDEQITSCLLENLPVDIRAALYPPILQMLNDEGFIDSNIWEKSIQLYHLIISIEKQSAENANASLFSVLAIRTSAEWRTIFELSDEIRRGLYF